MLRHSITAGAGSLLRRSTSLTARPLLSASLSRPSIRSLATSTKAHEHYSKAFKTIDKPTASSTLPTTSPYPAASKPAPTAATPSPAATSPTTPSSPPSDVPTTEPTPATASPTAPSASSSPSLPPRLGTAAPYARRLSQDTPSPFSATPPDEPASPFDDPNSIMGRLWDGFAYFFRTFLQGMLIFGWVLVATRIFLTFYPIEEWGKTVAVTDAATDDTAASASTNSAVVLVPVAVESNTQTAAQ